MLLSSFLKSGLKGLTVNSCTRMMHMQSQVNGHTGGLKTFQGLRKQAFALNKTASVNVSRNVSTAVVCQKNPFTFSGRGGLLNGRAMQAGFARTFAAAVADPVALAPDVTNTKECYNDVSGINVFGFINKNISRYEGDGSFLAGPTEATTKLWDRVKDLVAAELKAGGVLDVDPSVPSSIVAFPAGYIEKDLEVIKGLQTDKPLKRSIKPYGGYNMVKAALESYGYTPDPAIEDTYTKIRKTHNAGVFDAYTAEMKAARKSAILTGLPDGYGRGRIIGDYRRVALYGTDALVKSKKSDLAKVLLGTMDDETIRLREEVQEQIRSLNELKEMAATYGDDVSKPAATAREAVQWLYYG